MKRVPSLSRGAFLLLSMLASAALPAAEPLGRRTYANPIDLDYRYNFEQLNDGGRSVQRGGSFRVECGQAGGMSAAEAGF